MSPWSIEVENFKKERKKREKESSSIRIERLIRLLVIYNNLILFEHFKCDDNDHRLSRMAMMV